MSIDRAPSPWTEERIARLRVLFAEGLSASAIGADLDCTRNAVIGKAHRLGLARVEHPSSAPKKSRGRKVDNEPNGARAARLVSARALSRSLPPVLPPPQHVPGKTIFELGLNDCRWPIGDERTPAKLFCGAQALSGRPYCDRHCRIGDSRGR